MDVWGPSRVSEQSRERYFLLVVDDYTRYTTVFPLCSKSKFYHPTLRLVFPSQDVTFDESVPIYHLFPYCSAPLPPPLLFLAPGPPPIDPLPPQGPALSGVSQVDPLLGNVPVEVAVGSGAARGVASWGAASGGAETGGAESEGTGSRGAESGDAEPGSAELGGVEPEGVEPQGAESGGAEPRGTASSGGLAAAGVGNSVDGDTRGGDSGVTAGAGGTRGAAAAGPGGARTGDTGAIGTGGVGGAGARDPTEPGAAGVGAGAGGVGAGGTGAGGAGAGGVGAVDLGAGGVGAGGAGGTGAGDTMRLRPYFVFLRQQVLGVLSSTSLPPPLLCQPPDQSRPQLQPTSSLSAPSPYTEQTGGLTEHREPASLLASPICIGHRVPRPHPPPVPCTHTVIVTIGLNVPKTKVRVHRRISAQRLQTLIAFCSQLQMTCCKLDLERLDVAYNKQFRLHDLIKD
ncbi:unnamed protein product [Closterium sp. NIES-54]